MSASGSSRDGRLERPVELPLIGLNAPLNPSTSRSSPTSSLVSTSSDVDVSSRLRIDASPSRQAILLSENRTSSAKPQVSPVPGFGQSLEALLMEDAPEPQIRPYESHGSDKENEFDGALDVNLPEGVTDEENNGPINYADDIREFVLNASFPINVFQDPFENEERRSRTEQWVENCSPRIVPTLSMDSDVNVVVEGRLESSRDEDLSPLRQEEPGERIPQVNVEVASEDRTHFATSSELNRSDADELKDDVDISLASSDADREGVPFRSTLHLALADAGHDVDLKDFDRFWLYMYKRDDAKELERLRAVTPTVERVVTYYTHHAEHHKKKEIGEPQPASNFSLSSSDESLPLKKDVKIGTEDEDDEDDELVPSPEAFEAVELQPESSGESALISIESATDFFKLRRDESSSRTSGPDSDHQQHGRRQRQRRRRGTKKDPTKLVSVATSTEDLHALGADLESHWGGGQMRMGGAACHSWCCTHGRNRLAGDAMNDARESPSPSFLNCDLDSTSTDELLQLQLGSANGVSPNKSVSFNFVPSAEIGAPANVQRVVSPTRSILKKEDDEQKSMRRFLELAGERLFRDLKVLVTERDRARNAIDILPAKNAFLSAEADFFQTRYRQKIQENKSILDQRIEEVWKKLSKLPLNDEMAAFVGSVEESSQLTLHVRRNIPKRVSPIRNVALEAPERRGNGILLASLYAERLADVRAQMIRCDSESSIMGREDESIVNLMNRVSRALEAKHI